MNSFVVVRHKADNTCEYMNVEDLQEENINGRKALVARLHHMSGKPPAECEQKLEDMQWDFEAVLSEWTDRTQKHDAAC